MKSPIAAAADQAAKRIITGLASQMREGELRAVFPDGRRRTYGTHGASPSATLFIHDDAFFSRVLAGGEIGVGEAYVDGLWSADDLVALLELGVANRRHAQFNALWLHQLSRVRNIRLHRGRRNTIEGARDNIHAHYDLGNEFFRTFLDDTMTYSSAYFRSPGEPLIEAQRNKYRMLCEKAGIRRGNRVLEIGSGWGGFALFAALNYGCHVTTITISNEQLALAKEVVADARLGRQIDVQFRDYRDITGDYDAIVSIEMFEAVGAEYFAAFFQACDRVLKPGGRLAMQTITVPDRSFEAVRDGVNWVQKYIFPGGMLPSIAELERAVRDTSFVLTGTEDIGPHYAVTLHQWRERFMASLPAVRELGFDDRFIRMWEYYLAIAEAGFLTRNAGDVQAVFEKSPRRAVPAWPAAQETSTRPTNDATSSAPASTR